MTTPTADSRRVLHTRHLARVLSGALLASALGCSTQGTGSGTVTPSSAAAGAEKGGPVTFTWASDGASVTKGTIAAVVPDHGEFRGQYIQVHSQTEVSDLDAVDWEPGWGTWDGWGAAPDDAFIEAYSGRVVATLQSAGGDTMRCRFVLAEPDEGPEGGGMGECQLSDGSVVQNATLQGGD